MFPYRSNTQSGTDFNPPSLPVSEVTSTSSHVFHSPSVEDSLSPDMQKRLLQAQISQTKKKVAFSFLCENCDFQYAEDQLRSIVGVECGYEEKFRILNIEDLIISNLKSKVPLPKVTAGFRVLIKFGQNLLQPEVSRPKHWRRIMLSGNNFVPVWADVRGSVKILQSYGYTLENDRGLEFPEGQQPNTEQVSFLSAELLLLTVELELFHKSEHPCALKLLALLKKAQKSPAQAEYSYVYSTFHPSGIEHPRISIENLFSRSLCNSSANSSISSASPARSFDPPKAFRPIDTPSALSNSSVQPDAETKPCTSVQLVIPKPIKISESHQRSSFHDNKACSSSKKELETPLSLPVQSNTTEKPPRIAIHSKLDENNETVQKRSPIIDIASRLASHVYNAATPWFGINTEILNMDEHGVTFPLSDDIQEEVDIVQEQPTEKEKIELSTPSVEELNENQVAIMVLRRTASDRDPRVRDGSHCDLCGCSAPAVRCEKCSHQIFCLSCDDMYHRHPKRRSHVRKAVDPPLILPPKPAVKPVEPPRVPVPPPRRRKSQKSVPSSPVFGRRGSENQNPPLPKKEFSFMDKVGSLRRFMIGRPLPPVPKDEAPERPPKNSVWEQPQDKPEQFPVHNMNSLIHLRKQSAGSFSNASNESGSMQRPSPVVSDNEANSMARNNYPNSRSGMHSPGYDNVPSPAERNWDDMQQTRTAAPPPHNQWDPVGQNVGFQPQQSSYPNSLQQTSYPNSLNKSDADSGVHSFQGFPTLPKRGQYPNQYLDRSGTLTRANAPMHSASICDIPNRPLPQHPQMAMQPLPQAQSVQSLSYATHPHMGQGDTAPFMDQCGPCHSVPWMGMHHPAPCCHGDPQGPYPPDMLKRTPSQTSINFPSNGSESGYRLNSYTSMGHLVNPGGMMQPHHYQHPHHHGHHSHNNRPPSPTLSTHSSRLRNAQSVAADLGSPPSYYRGGRRSGYHGGGRRSAMDVTSSEDDYFSAGASDEEDCRSVRSAGRNSEHRSKNPPNRQWQCEHCTFINPPGSRICSVCCKTTAHPKVASDRRRRRAAGGAKSPSSGESLPPMAPRQSSRNGKENVSSNQAGNIQDEGQSSEQPNGEPEMELHNYIEESLKISPVESSPVSKSAENRTPGQNSTKNTFQEFGHSDDAGREDKLPAGTSSTKQENIMQVNGDNPPSSATNNVEEAQPTKKVASTSTSPPPQAMITQTDTNDDTLLDDSRPMFRSTSRGSLTGIDRDFSMLRRSSSTQVGPSGDVWGPPPYSHRSVSRSSLFGPQSRDESPLRSLRGDPDYPGYRDRHYPYDSPSRSDFYLNLEDLIERRRQETMRTQGFELVRLLRDAEQHNFTADDLQVALSHCGTQNPIQWLTDNWKNMIDTVVTLVTNYGRDKNENDIGVVSSQEAKECLRAHKGNIWAAVTECVEIRQRKFREMQARGDFAREEITGALTANQGNLEAAFLELSKNVVKPFTMKIWGPPVGIENDSGSTLPLAKMTSSSSQIKSPASSPRTKSPTQSIITGKLTLPLAVPPEDVSVITESIATTTTTVSVLTSSLSTTTASPQAASTTATVTTSSALIASSWDSSSEDGSNSPATWRKAVSGGGSAVGGSVLQPSEYVSSNSATFKPANTSRRLSRTGSFSGGSFQSEDDVLNNSSNNVKTTSSPRQIPPPKNDVDDLYVTVQWVSGKKPDDLMAPITPKAVALPPKKGKTPLPPPPLNSNAVKTEASNDDTVYASVQLLSTPEIKHKDAKLENSNTNINNVAGKQDNNIYSTVEFISSSGSKDKNSLMGKNNSSAPSTLNKNVINANLTNVIRSSDFNEGIYAPLEFIRAQGVSRSRCNSPSRSRCSSPGPLIRPASPIPPPVINRTLDHVAGKAIHKPVPRPLSPILPLKNESASVTDTGENVSPVINRKFEFHPSPLVTGHGKVRSPSALSKKVDSAPSLSGGSRQQFVPSPATHQTSPLVKDSSLSPVPLQTSPLVKDSSPSPVPLQTSPVVRDSSPSPAPLQTSPLVKDSSVSPVPLQTSPLVKDTSLSPIPLQTSPLVNEVSPSPTLHHKEFTPSPMTTLSRSNASSPLLNQNVTSAMASPRPSSPIVNHKSADISIDSGDSGLYPNHESINDALETLVQDTNRLANSLALPETDDKLFEQNTDISTDVRPPTPPLRTESSKLSPQFDFERRARMLLAEGKVPSYEKAELAVKLIDLNFDENDALAAAFDCSDISMAISYLQQDCELCAGKFPMRQMISMLNCTHCCCEGCAQAYFSIQIRDRNIMEAVCPFCNEPDLTDDDIAQDYFNNLDIVLKSLVEPDVHELFQRKLRDRTLMRDPNFHWCSQCSSGFISHPYAKRLMCPDCQVITCAQCRKPWEAQHEGITCEKFSEWLEANDPEFQAVGLEKHLAENGIDCPNCRFRYSLAKGGCMHFKCLQCKFDFCSGCGRPFKMGSKCTFSQHCIKLGLHAHHPRNCLFYLRDKEPVDLQKLLTEQGIPFDTEPIPGSTTAMTESALRKCQVMEQKEVPGGIMKDEICGNEVPEKHAGLCRLHYLEYLGGLIMKHHIDPLVVYSEDDLEACFRRWGLRLPGRAKRSTAEIYRQQLIKVDPATILDVNELQQEFRRRGKDVPDQEKRQSDIEYRESLIKTIQEQIPLDEADTR